MTAVTNWEPRYRTHALGPFRLHTSRTVPDSQVLLLIYPLFGKRGLLVTIWHRRFEFRW